MSCIVPVRQQNIKQPFCKAGLDIIKCKPVGVSMN